MLVPALAFALILQQPAPSPISRITVTPASLIVIAGDTLRLRAQAMDASGRPVPDARVLFQAGGAAFEAHVDSAGLVTSGAVGTFPIVVTAFVPGSKPTIERVEVHM